MGRRIESTGATREPLGQRNTGIRVQLSRRDFIRAAWSAQGFPIESVDPAIEAHWKDGGKSMDSSWNRWSSFLDRQGHDPADFGRESLIGFVSSFGTNVPAGSQKLSIAAVTTTYRQAFGIDLNIIAGGRWDALYYTKKASRKEKAVHTLDTLPYVMYWANAPPDVQLSDAMLQLKTLVLLRIAGFRSVDLANLPAGDGAGYRWSDDGFEIRAFNTKTSNSKGDISRQGWTEFSQIRPIDPNRLSEVWSFLGVNVQNPDRVCPVRTFRSFTERFGPIWSKHGGSSIPGDLRSRGGVASNAAGCFLKATPVVADCLQLADAELLSTRIRNFHNDVLVKLSAEDEHPIRRMCREEGLSPGFLRHGAVSRLLYLGRTDDCLNRTRHVALATARQYYQLPLDSELQDRLDRITRDRPSLASTLSADEWLLV
jgi:hypothetical protein